MDRSIAVDRLVALLEQVDAETMPVPVREIWVYGDLVLGLDPIDRLNVYITKDVLLSDETPDRVTKLAESYDVKGLGRTVRGEWAERYPDFIRTNDNGYAAPEKCLAAHLLDDEEPIHLEVCNTGFEDNVTQRLRGAQARGSFEEILDPRGVCLWVDGHRSPTAFEKLRKGEFVFPTLPDALTMLDLDAETAKEAAETLQAYRSSQTGATVRGDVV